MSNEQKVYLDDYVDHKVSNSDDLSIMDITSVLRIVMLMGEKMLEFVLAVDAAIIIMTLGMMMVVVSAVVYAVVSIWESTSKDKKTKVQKEYEVRLDKKTLKHHRENTIRGVNTVRILLFGTGVFVLSSSMM